MPWSPDATQFRADGLATVNASPGSAEISVVDGEFASRSPTSPAWFVSILFWTFLLLAATMYGAVALSPKLAEWRSTREQFSNNAVQLVRLEDEVVYLERVAQALRQDPEFARRIALAPTSRATDTPTATSHQPSVSARLRSSGSHEHLPVAPELRFGSVTPDASPRTQVDQPAFADVVVRFAREAPLRRCLLATSVLLILFSFTFLNESENGYIRCAARAISGFAMFPIRRYRAVSAPKTVSSPKTVVADAPMMPQSPPVSLRAN